MSMQMDFVEICELLKIRQIINNVIREKNIKFSFLDYAKYSLTGVATRE
jgi:hypothetical protein